MTRRKASRGRRIVILCEGKTEEKAVEHFIRPQWERDGLGSTALVTKNLKAKMEDVFKRLPIHRNEDGVIGVFTLIDLCGMNRVKHDPEHSLSEKVEKVRDWLRNDFDADLLAFFHPHLSVHEIEAWLPADGQCIDKSIKPDPNAEEKDFENPPKTRVDNILKKLRNGDGYREVIDGTAMFKNARFDVVHQSCCYFSTFYDDLKKVAKDAQQG